MERTIKILDLIVFSLICLFIFYLPVSSAIIEVSSCSAIFFWLVKRIIQSKKKDLIFFSDNPLRLPIFLFMAVLLISVIQGSETSIGLRHFLRKTLQYIGIFYVILDTLNSAKRIKIVSGFLIASIILVASDCLWQYFFKFEFLRHRVAVSGRISGPFEYPDQFGNYWVTVLSVVFAFFLSRIKNKINFFLLTFLLFIMVFIFLINNSKGSLLAFLFVYFFFFWFTRRKLFLILIPVFFVIGGIFLSPFYKELIVRQLDFKNSSYTQRFDLWETGILMFKDKPLFGQGLGSYMSNYERFQSKKNRPLAEQGIWYAHNSYLQMLSETGLIGLLSFLLIVAVIFKNILAAFRGLKDEQFFSLLLGFSGGLLGYLVQIFSDSTYYSLANSVLFWFFLGVVSSILIVLKNNKYKTD